jgi:signal transduction histidine kinase
MSAEADVSASWLHLLQSLVDHVAHDLRNDLNGLAVNLEVVRGRAERGAEAAAVAPFAVNASDQFEKLSRRTMALLGLSRRSEGAGDIALVLRQLSDLFGEGEGGAPRLALTTGSGGVSAETSAPADAVRVALAAATLACTEEGGSARYSLAAAQPVRVYIHREDDSRVALPETVATILRAHGISVQCDAAVLSLTFPPPPGKE